MNQTTDNKHHNSMRDSVLKVIETGRVKMKPKWEFVLQSILLLAGISIVALTTVYLASLLVFILRRTGAWFAPGFGLEGVGIFFGSMPWWFLGLIVVFVVVLEILVKRYAFGYRKPFLYSIMGILMLVVLGGVLIGSTSFHKDILDKAERGLPGAEFLERDLDGLTPGKIIAVTDSGYQIQTPRGEYFNVIISSKTRFESGVDLRVGDSVVVLGQRQDGEIQAREIQKHGNVPPPPESNLSQDPASPSAIAPNQQSQPEQPVNTLQ